MDLGYSYREGDGVPLFYLHGWLGDRRSLQAVDSHLEADNPRLFYDQRCHGDSPCSSFDIEDLAADLEEVLQHKDMEEPVLAGHSLGGMVALAYGLRNPVAGLALAGTPPWTPEPADASPAYFLDRLGSMERDEWADRIVKNYAPQDEQDRETVREELIEAGETVLRSGLETMIDFDVRDRLVDIDCPARVISGADDRAVPIHQGEELAEGLGCDHVVLEASHLMHREQPEAVADAIASVIEEVSG